MSLSTFGFPTFMREERSSTTWGCRIVSVVFLFGVVAQMLRWFEEPLSPAWAALEQIKEPVDIAIVGDSRPHVGISPARLGATLESVGGGRPSVHNFSVDGTDALHHASFVIQGLLRRIPPPAVIVWATNPLGFNEERRSNRLEQLTVYDIPMLWKNNASLETLLDVATAEVFPPYRQRAAFRRTMAGIADSLAWFPVHIQTRLLKLEYSPLPQSRQTLHLESGYQPFEIIRWRGAFDQGAVEYARKYRTARLSSLHLDAAKDLLRAAKQSGTSVLIVEMPVAPWFRENLEGCNFHRHWRRSMERLANEEGGFFMQHAVKGPRDEFFGDPGHMDHRSSLAYSAWLGGELGKIPEVMEALHKAGRFKNDPLGE